MVPADCAGAMLISAMRRECGPAGACEDIPACAPRAATETAGSARNFSRQLAQQK